MFITVFCGLCEDREDEHIEMLPAELLYETLDGKQQTLEFTCPKCKLTTTVTIRQN